ncbi:MAG: DUF2141 domain-containing protein [Alphaproteobacteria bacterium]|nr:DUF2141 domain-containing protein [Alphaproteobacteria bacterium]
MLNPISRLALAGVTALVAYSGALAADYAVLKKDERIDGLVIRMVADRIDPERLGACENPPRYDDIRVVLQNVRSNDGNIRISLYNSNPNEWLAKGAKLIRFDVPAQKGVMEICLPVPYHGDFAFGLYHDENADTDMAFFKEGYGFSNNVKVFLSKPDHEEVEFYAGEGRTEQEIFLRY